MRNRAGMARFWLILTFVVLVVGPAAADPGDRTLTFDGRERTYHVYAPDSLKPLPLLVLLHGSGGNGLFMLAQWKDLAAREGILLLAPDSRHTDVGWELRSDGPDFIRATIDAVAASHPIDVRRMYLFGQSGGAVYALTLSLLESEYFAAAAFHAGGWRQPAEYHVLDYARRKIPIGIWVGDKDEYFSLGSVENTQRLLIHSGFPAQLTVLRGRHHSILDVPADFNASVWAFVKAQSLPGDPTFARYRLGATAPAP
jgi:predicted esterase